MGSGLILLVVILAFALLVLAGIIVWLVVGSKRRDAPPDARPTRRAPRSEPAAPPAPAPTPAPAPSEPGTCTNCGAKQVAGDRFCTECGAELHA